MKHYAPAPLRWALHLVLGALALLTLLPFVWLICASIKSDVLGSTFLPKLGTWGEELTLGHYRRLFVELDFVRYILNSAFLATATTVLVIVTSSMGGFALAKYKFKGQGIILAIMVSSMMIPGEVLLGPTFEIIFYLNWLDTYWALLVPTMVSVVGIFFFRQAFLNMPTDIIEAARLDGAGELKIWWEMGIYQVRPMIGAFGLFTFLGTWNNFLWPQIVLRTSEKLTLPVILTQFSSVYGTDYGLIMAGTIMSIMPVVVIFFLFQKDFISGLTQGAIK